MKDKPNILLIMTDQQRGDCLGIEHHPVLLTPNMDRIAGDGARFSRCYSTCPLCVPARRSLLTGQFPARRGFESQYDRYLEQWDSDESLVQSFRSAGYHTYLVGREMHQSPVRKRYGFDHMVITPDYERFLDRQAPTDTYGPPGRYRGDYYTSGVMHNDWTARTWHLDEALHQTNWTMNEAMKFMETRDPSVPYFLVVSFLAPHPPLIPPAFYMDRYLRQELPPPVLGQWAVPPEHGGRGDDVSADRVLLQGEAMRSARAGYYGLINHVDDQLRRLLNPVDGVDRDHTIVMFTSDHGEMLGDHYMWKKSVPYEGSARVPLLVSAPVRYGIRPGTVIDQPVGLEDILPTLLDMVDLPVPEGVDGRSLLPLMRGEPVVWRPWMHIEFSAGNIHHHTLVDGKEKYIWYFRDGTEQCFNLADDPEERCNLAGLPVEAHRIRVWRDRMLDELKHRAEHDVFIRWRDRLHA